MGGEQSKDTYLEEGKEISIADLTKYLANKTLFTKNEVTDLVEHFRWINYQVNGSNDVKGVTNDPESIVWLLGFWGCTLDQVPVLKDYFTAMDTNVDGSIDVDEYLSALSIMARGSDEEQLLLMFHSIDTDRDDIITRDQIKDFVHRLISTEVFWMNFYQILEKEDGVHEELDFDVSDVRRDAQIEMEFRAIVGSIKNEGDITPKIFVESLMNSGFEITYVLPVVDQLKTGTLKDLRAIPDGRGEVAVDVDDGTGASAPV